MGLFYLLLLVKSRGKVLADVTKSLPPVLSYTTLEDIMPGAVKNIDTFNKS
jgi:hypothetical protein